MWTRDSSQVDQLRQLLVELKARREPRAVEQWAERAVSRSWLPDAWLERLAPKTTGVRMTPSAATLLATDPGLVSAVESLYLGAALGLPLLGWAVTDDTPVLRYYQRGYRAMQALRAHAVAAHFTAAPYCAQDLIDDAAVQLFVLPTQIPDTETITLHELQAAWEQAAPALKPVHSQGVTPWLMWRGRTWGVVLTVHTDVDPEAAVVLEPRVTWDCP